MNSPIYLDYKATTPVAPEVSSAIRPWIEEQFGNSSSSHIFGQRVRRGISDAMLHLSVGLEDAEDLIADLEQALR